MDRQIILRGGSPVGWFDVDCVESMFEARATDMYRSVRLYRLKRGAWVREETNGSENFFVHVDDKAAALWLIAHKFYREVEALLPEAVAATKF